EGLGVAAHDLGEALREPARETRHLVVLQEHDGPHHGLIVGGEAARAVEGIHAAPAGEAEGPGALGGYRRREGPSATLTGWPAQRDERGEAGGADRNGARRGEGCFADAARRGKEHRGQRIECVTKNHKSVVNGEGTKKSYLISRAKGRARN